MSKYNIEIADEAFDDIYQIITWYNDKRKNLGLEFEKEITALIDNLRSNPFIFQIRKRYFRHALMKKFPYKFIYEVSKQNVIIYGVMHVSRPQLYIYKRINKK